MSLFTSCGVKERVDAEQLPLLQYDIAFGLGLPTLGEAEFPSVALTSFANDRSGPDFTYWHGRSEWLTTSSLAWVVGRLILSSPGLSRKTLGGSFALLQGCLARRWATHSLLSRAVLQDRLLVRLSQSRA
jgi:hypothetical protein